MSLVYQIVELQPSQSGPLLPDSEPIQFITSHLFHFLGLAHFAADQTGRYLPKQIVAADLCFLDDEPGPAQCFLLIFGSFLDLAFFGFNSNLYLNLFIMQN